MAKILIYTKTRCPYCEKAKGLFNKKGASYEEKMIYDQPEEVKKLMERTGMRTFPQIFIDNKLIGGFSELKALDDEGGLDPLLK